MFFKTGFLKISINFTGKHLCWSLFLIKLQAFRTAPLLKRVSNTAEIFKTFQNTFFYITTPVTTPSVYASKSNSKSASKSFWDI